VHTMVVLFSMMLFVFEYGVDIIAKATNERRCGEMYVTSKECSHSCSCRASPHFLPVTVLVLVQAVNETLNSRTRRVFVTFVLVVVET